VTSLDHQRCKFCGKPRRSRFEFCHRCVYWLMNNARRNPWAVEIYAIRQQLKHAFVSMLMAKMPAVLVGIFPPIDCTEPNEEMN
jgi:hypothetical protein